jgi:hypothetical protein
MDASFEAASNLVCLLYHEARYLRRSIQAGKLLKHPKYNRICSLPRDRYEAWRELSEVRKRASEAQTAEDLASVYQKAYSLTLKNLCNLYGKPIWVSGVGGSNWAKICEAVYELLMAIDSGNKATIEHLLSAIHEMNHNTGTVNRKLKQLEADMS